ncbi:MAG: hypothetical protein BECKG1743E_GA0114224_103848, partial [Candidatus Kentron sp. G]
STLQLRATMSAIRHPCLIMGQCPSNFEGRNTIPTGEGLPETPCLRRGQYIIRLSPIPGKPSRSREKLTEHPGKLYRTFGRLSDGFGKLSEIFGKFPRPSASRLKTSESFTAIR